jgi:hypothetical protein
VSAISLILLLAAAVAAVLGGAALHAARGLHRQVAQLREELGTAGAGVPAARAVPAAEEVRAAVAEALAEERERELAEARAFWAAQEARDAGAAGDPLLAGRGTEFVEVTEATAAYEVGGADAALLDAFLAEAYGTHEIEAYGPHEPHERQLFLPRQPDGADAEPPVDAQAPADPAAESAELAAARRRHPSNPRYTLSGEPVSPAPTAAEDHARTVARLGELAAERTELTDVRPGPLGTLDVYVFADGTTVCMSPGHRETADHLVQALRDGAAPVLLGGSGVSGGYALTFGCGEKTVYVLADRVIASL